MDRREIEELVRRILRKRAGGEKLTNREERILAYAYFAERRQRMTTRVEPTEGYREPE